MREHVVSVKYARCKVCDQTERLVTIHDVQQIARHSLPGAQPWYARELCPASNTVRYDKKSVEHRDEIFGTL